MKKILILFTFIFINQVHCTEQNDVVNTQVSNNKQGRKIIVNEITNSNGEPKVIVSEIGDNFPIDLRPGDIIEKVNGRDISNILQLRQILKEINRQDYQLTMTINRNKAKITSTISNKQSIDEISGEINQIKHSSTQSEEINDNSKTISETSQTVINNGTPNNENYSVEKRFNKTVFHQNGDEDNQLIYSSKMQVGNFNATNMHDNEYKHNDTTNSDSFFDDNDLDDSLFDVFINPKWKIPF